MLNTKRIRTLTALAAVVALVLTNGVVRRNRRRGSQRTGPVHPAERPGRAPVRELVKALADLSVRDNDGELRDMLAKQGITVSSNTRSRSVGRAGGRTEERGKVA